MPASPPDERLVEASDKPKWQHWLPRHESKTANEITDQLSKTASYSFFRRVLIIFLLSIPLLTTGLISYLTLGNHPYTLNESWAGGNIVLSVDRQWVLFTNSCINVTWKIDHIREVYLNGKGVVGEGKDTVCLNNGKPYFMVRFQGNLASDRTYFLPVEALLAKPEIWLLLILAVASTFTAGYMIPISLLHRVKRSHVKRLARWTIVPFILLVLVLVGLEVAIRFYYSNYGTREDRISYLYNYDEIKTIESHYIPLPYVGYGLTPSYGDHNSLGYRGPEIDLPKPAGVFRIVALGSSVTYGTALYRDDTYPMQLQNILAEDYGYTNVEVINAGVPGYTSWEYLTAFEFRLLSLEPDLVIVYESANDITMRFMDPKFYNSINIVRGLWNTTPPNYPISALYRFIGIKLGWMNDPNKYQYDDLDFVPITNINTCWQDITIDHCPSMNNISKDQLLEINPPIYYEQNMRSLIGIAQAHGVEVLLSTWAYFPDPLPGYEEQYMIYPDRQKAVAEHNQILRDLGNELGVLFYDLQSTMPYNADFWRDGRHMSAPGAHEQANEYAKFLVEQKVIPQP